MNMDDQEAAQRWLVERNVAHNTLRAIHEILMTKDGEWDIHHEQGEKLQDIVEMLKRWNSEYKPSPKKPRHTSCEEVSQPVTPRKLRDFLNTIPENDLDLKTFFCDSGKLLEITLARQIQHDEDEWVSEAGEGPLVFFSI